jgi:serine/threonine protein phosphatase PrpC
MEKDEIQIQLQRWLSRKIPPGSIRQVSDLPISLASDVGLVREENQDRLVLMRAQVTSKKSFLVGVLCDGMGGMIDGKDCAELAVSTFISSCIRYRKLNVRERLLQAVHSSNDAVFKKYQGEGGATLSAFILDSDMHLEAVNVGDSRIYVATGNKFEQVTKDDTIAGQVSDEFAGPEVSHSLLQHIGIGSSIEPHLIVLPDTESISKILITSDGTHYIPHATLKSIVSPSLSPIELSKRLIHVAKWCGGHDNASVLLLSDLSSLFTSDVDVHTGTIAVWDPYGDIQLIGIDRSYSLEESHILNKDSDNNEPEVKTSSDAKESSDDVVPSDKATNYSKRKKKPKDDTKKTPEKPQLRIDFE